MVLDTIHENKFIFKNTYAENKQVEIPVDKGPLEFYYVHIELTEEGVEKLKGRTSNKPADLLSIQRPVVTTYTVNSYSTG